MRTVMCVVEYDGTDYHGFQIQPNVATIQGVMQNVLATVTGCPEPVKIGFAGRTDAGVHATGQVIGFTTDSRLAGQALVRAANSLLPASIALRSAGEARPEFDPRRDALHRTYRYTWLNRPTPSPLLARLTHHVEAGLDVKAMDEACRRLEGRHDFKAFGTDPALEEPRAQDQQMNTVREVHRARCWREGELVLFEITATAFLRKMVRRLAGALLRVGLGRVTPDHISALLAGTISDPGPSVPARGLCLTNVAY